MAVNTIDKLQFLSFIYILSGKSIICLYYCTKTNSVS